MTVRERQDVLEPVRGGLQAKEADLNERQVLLDRRRAELEEREAALEERAAELARLTQQGDAIRRDNDDAERRLALLWDDLHQRQQVLEDVDASLRVREERLSATEHRRASRGADAEGWGAWPAPEPDIV